MYRLALNFPSARSITPRMEAATSQSQSAGILLEAVSGLKIEARLVPHGAPFGPDGRYSNTSVQPLVEFRRHGVRPILAYLNTYPADYFGTISKDVRFSPDSSLRFAIPTGELQRLTIWISEMLGRDDGDELI